MDDKEKLEMINSAIARAEEKAIKHKRNLANTCKRLADLISELDQLYAVRDKLQKPKDLPLVRIGQGEYIREYYA